MKATSISSPELLDSNSLARGLAMLAVVLCHVPYADPFWRPLWAFASAGKLAVSVFLFSSGLLLQHQVNRAGGLEILPWLKKRFWRIYPLYWTGLALALVCARIFRHKTFAAAALAANVAGIPLVLRQPVISSGYTSPFWFISLLLACYVLFLFVHGVRRKGWLVGGALLVSFVGLRGNHFMGAALLAFPAFFMGMWMADELARRGEASSDVRLQAAIFLPLLAVLALVFKGARYFHLDPRYSVWLELAGCLGLTVVPWPALVLVAFVRKTLARLAPALLRGLLWTSGLSFAVYCIHEPLLIILEKGTQTGHPGLGLLLYAGATLGAAWGLEAAGKRLSPANRRKSS